MGDTVVLIPQQSQTGLLAPNSVVYDVCFQVVLAQVLTCIMHDESLKAYLAPTGLVSEPRGDLTFRGV